MHWQCVIFSNLSNISLIRLVSINMPYEAFTAQDITPIPGVVDWETRVTEGVVMANLQMSPDAAVALNRLLRNTHNIAYQTATAQVQAQVNALTTHINNTFLAWGNNLDEEVAKIAALQTKNQDLELKIATLEGQQASRDPVNRMKVPEPPTF